MRQQTTDLSLAIKKVTGLESGLPLMEPKKKNSDSLPLTLHRSNIT
jgi:hypothetical protein